ncbi:MAG TPA: cyclic pyranopterin monophosphate synthase MoaC, partial [Mycobacterium sp.]
MTDPAAVGSPGSARRALSHIDESGAAHMVDVTGKDATKRTAVAAGTLHT